MRLENLWRRIAASPRAVVLALVGLFALLSPGLIAGRGPARPGGPDAARLVVLELRCRDGVFAGECLRALERVSAELESRVDQVERVESLANARVPYVQAGELGLAPLVRTAPADEAERRALRARVRADTALWRRFVASEERATRVLAALAPGVSAGEAHALFAALRARFAAPPEIELHLLPGWVSAAAERGARGRAWLELCVAAAAAVALGVWLAFGRAASLAPLALVASATLALCASLAEALGAERGEALATTACFLPALGGAHLALLRRVRVERRGGAPLDGAVASALVALGPALALAAGAALACGVALLAGLPAAASASAAAALALGAGLALEPLALAAALQLVLPGLARGESGRWASAIEQRIERIRTRSDTRLRARPLRARLALAAVAALALGGVALVRVEAGAGETARRLAIDARAPGAALEPALQERVLALQRALEAEPGVASASSLADAVLLPALRAEHGGDPVFAVVPPLRDDVARIVHAWQRAAPSALRAHLDEPRSRLFVTWLADPDSGIPPGALELRARELARASLRDSGAVLLPADAEARTASARELERAAVAGLALAWVSALIGFTAWLRSAAVALACTLPSALGSALALGLLAAPGASLDPASIGLPALALASGLGSAARLASRARELCGAGMDPRLAVSLAARQCGPALGCDALAGAALVVVAGLASPGAREAALLAGAAWLATSWLALAPLPALLRGLPPGWLVARTRLAANAGFARPR